MSDRTVSWTRISRSLHDSRPVIPVGMLGARALIQLGARTRPLVVAAGRSCREGRRRRLRYRLRGLPIQSRYAAAARCLSWPDTARFLFLLFRVRRLNRQLGAAHRRVERDGLDAGGPALLLTARRWLAAHEAMNALLGTPEIPEVGQVQASMRPRDEIRRPAGSAPHPAQGRLSQG